MKERFISFSDFSVSQAVNRWRFTLEGRVQSQAIILYVRFTAEKVALRQVFIRFFGLSVVVLIILRLYSLVSLTLLSCYRIS
jgi:hypothetical protein